ncbi:MAG: Gfo/Idh/MocA family oxidoreductase [Planctomycetota bacterium]|nr:Gfo/Idh/MocA family oxidoreductase [Planctomycetota bacterium]
MTNFRWGILSTGVIAGKFTEGLRAAEGHEACAVGSRSLASAQAFAERNGIRRAHATYEDLVADPEVDAIYVATPHTRHMQDTLTCLAGGKPVLCEKPIAVNASQGQRMVDAARERSLFLMEAMWTRFNPVIGALRGLVAGGAIGEPRHLSIHFGFRAEYDPTSRLFAPELAGGALLDVGVYCVAFASMLFGPEPEAVTGVATLSPSGVDEQCAFALRYPGGELAVLSAAVRTNTPQEAVLSGSEGTIRVPLFWCPDRLYLGDEERRFEVAGNGYHYQALEVAERVRAGEVESPLMPHAESLAIQRTLDTLRGQWGLRYPGE